MGREVLGIGAGAREEEAAGRDGAEGVVEEGLPVAGR